MPKVEAFSLPSILLRFYSRDHLPPHFHAIRPGKWELRIFFLRDEGAMSEVKYGSPSAAEKRALEKRAAEHRAELLAEWERSAGLVSSPHREQQEDDHAGSDPCN